MMPSYEFETKDGKVIECVFAMRDVPAIGSSFEHPLFGTVVRVPSGTQVSPNFTTSAYPYVSRALPRNLAGVKCDANGHPIIHSRREERNVASRHGYVRAED
jgi:hypothetical protein